METVMAVVWTLWAILLVFALVANYKGWGINKVGN